MTSRGKSPRQPLKARPSTTQRCATTPRCTTATSQCIQAGPIRSNSCVFSQVICSRFSSGSSSLCGRYRAYASALTRTTLSRLVAGGQGLSVINKILKYMLRPFRPGFLVWISKVSISGNQMSLISGQALPCLCFGMYMHNTVLARKRCQKTMSL